MLGSMRTAKVEIGEALADCTKVIDVSTWRLPSSAVTVSGREISCPGSGLDAVTETSTDSDAPGRRRAPAVRSGSARPIRNRIQ
jgi:hypothetical protein